MTDTISKKIKRKAVDLGFDKIGFAHAAPLEDDCLNLRKWLTLGYHGTMRWLENDIIKRTNPQKALPDAKSIISVAMNYYRETHLTKTEHTGKIARYAQGNDYHTVLFRRLNILLKFIKKLEPLAEGKIFIDSGTAMDKAWAERAGLGWRGKNTILITEEFGSWLVIGEIILNIELEYDSPAAELCGDCTLCLKACPTSALVQPYVLNSNRCISYLTVEYKNNIDLNLAKKFDRWIFGCDICQEVCPWNQKKSKQTGTKEFYPRDYNISTDISTLLELNKNEFNEKFYNSPIRRIKLKRLLRNAKIALLKQTI